MGNKTSKVNNISEYESSLSIDDYPSPCTNDLSYESSIDTLNYFSCIQTFILCNSIQSIVSLEETFENEFTDLNLPISYTVYIEKKERIETLSNRYPYHTFKTMDTLTNTLKIADLYITMDEKWLQFKSWFESHSMYKYFLILREKTESFVPNSMILCTYEDGKEWLLVYNKKYSVDYNTLYNRYNDTLTYINKFPICYDTNHTQCLFKCYQYL